MSRFLRAYFKLLDAINVLVKWISVPLCGSLVVVIAIQVITRSFSFIKTPPWTEELARYLMIAFAFIAASNGIKNWNNINVDFIAKRLPEKVQRYLNIVIQIAVLVLLIVVACLAWQSFSKIGFRQRSSTMGIQMILPQSTMIIGLILMSIQLTGVILKSILRGGEEGD
ncbi:MAG: TRAP transporter small permease [Clostridia bacterium]|nr:TRAP transporter small permease [Clostridia bacterium]